MRAARIFRGKNNVEGVDSETHRKNTTLRMRIQKKMGGLALFPLVHRPWQEVPGGGKFGKKRAKCPVRQAKQGNASARSAATAGQVPAQKLL